MSRRNTSGAVMLVAALCGCANPMLTMQLPGYSTTARSSVTDEADGMPQAIDKLNFVRAHYYEAIVAQSGKTQNATTGFVWLGTALAGLAAGHAHTDAILYPSLIGGTAYGLTRVQLDARRIRIWTAGMEALDCAKEASLPLMLGKAFHLDLDAAMARLASTRTDLDAASTRLQQQKATNEADALEVLKAIAKGGDVLAASANAARSAHVFRRAGQGAELSAAVDRIHRKVVEASNDIAVDVTAAKLLIDGLGGFASTFAPGAGLEAKIGRLFTAPDDTGRKAQAGTEMVSAMTGYAVALQDHRTATRRVEALLEAVDLGAMSAALSRCNVAGISTAIVLEPISLTLDEKTAQPPKTVLISGGVKPYSVTILNGAEGLSRDFAGGLADDFKVNITDKVPKGPYTIRVTDSGTTKRSAVFTINLAAKPASSDQPREGPAAAPAARTVPEGWKKLRAALLLKSAAIKQLQGTDLDVVSVTIAPPGLKIQLKCTPADAQLPLVIVREQLLHANPEAIQAADALTKLKAFGSDYPQLDLSPSGKCIKG